MDARKGCRWSALTAASGTLCVGRPDAPRTYTCTTGWRRIRLVAFSGLARLPPDAAAERVICFTRWASAATRLAVEERDSGSWKETLRRCSAPHTGEESTLRLLAANAGRSGCLGSLVVSSTERLSRAGPSVAPCREHLMRPDRQGESVEDMAANFCDSVGAGDGEVKLSRAVHPSAEVMPTAGGN